MTTNKQKLELTWIGKANRPRLEPRILLEDPAKSDHAPHRVIELGLEGGVFVRVGSTNRRADRDLCDELRRFGRGEAYDEQPLPELDSEAIDFRVASELAGQKQIRALEGQRNSKRKSLFEAQDEIDLRRERLIADIDGKLAQITSTSSPWWPMPLLNRQSWQRILRASHPSHRSLLTEVTCIMDGYFFCARPALPGVVVA